MTSTHDAFWQGLPTCADLDKLLDERVEHPENMTEIDARINKQFKKEVTTFVLDMSGFSRLVQRYGILHYLAMIRRMRRVVGPCVERHGGLVVKFEADNCFAVFPEPEDAMRASLDIHHDLSVANLITPDESDVHVSIGVGYGPTLLACDDFYGDEVNLSSKLGEDVAERDEILFTQTAHERIKDADASFEEFPLTVSGLDLKAYRLKITT